jgi:hypothetical protein
MYSEDALGLQFTDRYSTEQMKRRTVPPLPPPLPLEPYLREGSLTMKKTIAMC